MRSDKVKNILLAIGLLVGMLCVCMGVSFLTFQIYIGYGLQTLRLDAPYSQFFEVVKVML